MRFLPINVPYHSRYLVGCGSVADELLGGSEAGWWQNHKKSMTVPVFNTATGGDIRQESDGLMASLAEQIFTRPIKWVEACGFTDGTTHVVECVAPSCQRAKH